MYTPTKESARIFFLFTKTVREYVGKFLALVFEYTFVQQYL